MSDSITISAAAYLEFLLARERLSCLTDAEVDKWVGWEEAVLGSGASETLKALEALLFKAFDGQELTIEDIRACLQGEQ